MFATRTIGPENNWSAFERVSADGAQSTYPALVRGANDTALVIYQTQQDSQTVLVANRFTLRGGGWEPPITLQPATSSPPTRASVASDPCGNAIALWARMSERGSVDLWANRYESISNTWQGPELLSGDYFAEPRVDLDANGNAVAVWGSIDGGLQVAHYR